MADPATRQEADIAQPSVGDLVALAVSDVTQLVKYEVDLAKMELKADARRLGIGAGLAGMAAFVGCLVLMLLSFAFAYGLMSAGVWSWLSFVFVAVAYAALALLAVLIATRKFRGFAGLRKTRSNVSDDLALIRRDDGVPANGSAGSR
jgi:uncharacterized membrane protein YqjE